MTSASSQISLSNDKIHQKENLGHTSPQPTNNIAINSSPSSLPTPQPQPTSSPSLEAYLPAVLFSTWKKTSLYYSASFAVVAKIISTCLRPILALLSSPTPQPTLAQLTSLPVVNRKTLVLIRHSESVWNDTAHTVKNFYKLHRSVPAFYRIFRYIVQEALLFPTQQSLFFDTPLTPSGLARSVEFHDWLNSNRPEIEHRNNERALKAVALLRGPNWGPMALPLTHNGVIGPSASLGEVGMVNELVGTRQGGKGDALIVQSEGNVVSSKSSPQQHQQQPTFQAPIPPASSTPHFDTSLTSSLSSSAASSSSLSSSTTFTTTTTTPPATLVTSHLRRTILTLSLALQTRLQRYAWIRNPVLERYLGFGEGGVGICCRNRDEEGSQSKMSTWMTLNDQDKTINFDRENHWNHSATQQNTEQFEKFHVDLNGGDDEGPFQRSAKRTPPQQQQQQQQQPQQQPQGQQHQPQGQPSSNNSAPTPTPNPNSTPTTNPNLNLDLETIYVNSACKEMSANVDCLSLTPLGQPPNFHTADCSGALSYFKAFGVGFEDDCNRNGDGEGQLSMLMPSNNNHSHNNNNQRPLSLPLSTMNTILRNSCDMSNYLSQGSSTDDSVLDEFAKWIFDHWNLNFVICGHSSWLKRYFSYFVPNLDNVYEGEVGMADGVELEKEQPKQQQQPQSTTPSQSIPSISTPPQSRRHLYGPSHPANVLRQHKIPNTGCYSVEMTQSINPDGSFVYWIHPDSICAVWGGCDKMAK